MSAFVVHSFRGGFLLDETRLRKIKDIVESREKKSPDSKLIYRVYRGDSYSYETETVDDVVNEDNEDWRRITRLVLHISRPAPSPTLEAHTTSEAAENNDLHFRLSFSDKEGCELRIAANDRDRVFLLFSDLRDYVQNEVTITRTIDQETSRFLGMLTSLVLIMLTMAAVAYTLLHVEPTSLAQVLRNPDIGAKLNYLIEQKTRPLTLRLLAIFIVLMGLSFFRLVRPRGSSSAIHISGQSVSVW